MLTTLESPFCDIVSPSGYWLRIKMWLHRFDVISQTIMSDTIICYINTIGIVPAYACNVSDALVASCATTG